MKNEFFSLPLVPPATLCDNENFGTQGIPITSTSNSGCCNCGSTCRTCGTR